MIPRLSRGKPWKTVREFHYSGTYRKDYARLQGGIRARVMAALSDFYESASAGEPMTLPSFSPGRTGKKTGRAGGECMSFPIRAYGGRSGLPPWTVRRLSRHHPADGTAGAKEPHGEAAGNKAARYAMDAVCSACMDRFRQLNSSSSSFPSSFPATT